VGQRRTVVKQSARVIRRRANLTTEMAERIHVGANLTNLGGQELVVPDGAAAGAIGAAGRAARHAQPKQPPGGERNMRVIAMAKRDDLSTAHQRKRLKHFGRALQIAIAALIVLAPARACPILGQSRAIIAAGFDLVCITHLDMPSSLIAALAGPPALAAASAADPALTWRLLAVTARPTAIIRVAPLNKDSTKNGAPSWLRPATVTAKTATASTVPHTLTRPGFMVVAPSRAAVNAGRRYSIPTELCPT